mgnify:CR=1 FL=1
MQISFAKNLKKAGHESPVHCENSDNGYCLCMVEADGERTFLTVPGIECHFQEEWFSSLAVDSYDSVYVSGYELEGDGGDAILKFSGVQSRIDRLLCPRPTNHLY